MNSISDELFYKIQQIEVDLRGRYLRFSAKLEANIIRNIILLNEEKFLQAQIESPLNFKELMFHKKIEKLEELLSELHSDLLTKYIDLFKHLYNFKEMRNKMAHDYFDWNEQNLNVVTIWEVVKDAKPQYLTPIEYSVSSIRQNLNDSMKNIIDNLNNLSLAIIERVKPKMPELFDLIDPTRRT